MKIFEAEPQKSNLLKFYPDRFPCNGVTRGKRHPFASIAFGKPHGYTQWKPLSSEKALYEFNGGA